MAVTPFRGIVIATLALASVAAPRVGARSAAASSPFVFTERSTPARAGHAMIFDARRRRWLVIGGGDGYSHSEIWQVVPGKPPRWLRLSSRPDGPLPVSSVGAVYDSLRDRVLLFGGARDRELPESDTLWTLDLSTLHWRSVDLPAPRPSARWGMSLVLDRLHDRLVMFGGSHSLDPNDELWTLSLADTGIWRRVARSIPWPDARDFHAAALEPSGDRMLLFGGKLDFTGFQGGFADTWELRLDNALGWDSVATPSPAPGALHGHALVPVPALGCVLMVGGRRNRPLRLADTLWAYSPASRSWSVVGPGPSVLGLTVVCSAVACDAATGVVLAHGGSQLEAQTVYPSHQLWTFDPGSVTWSTPTPDPEPIFAGSGALRSPIVTDLHARTVMVVADGQTWTRELREDSSWGRLSTTGEAPLGVTAQAAVLDSARGRLLLIGGTRENQTPWPTACDSIWSLSLGSDPHWTAERLDAPSGFIADDATPVLDARRDRVLLVGGTPPLASSHYRMQVWQLALLGVPTVEPVAPTDSTDCPFVRYRPGATIDPVRDRLLMFGGDGRDPEGRYWGDYWSFDLAGEEGWRLLLPDLGGLPHCSAAAMAYDATADRLLLYGGASGGLFNVGAHTNELFAMNLDEPPRWQQITEVTGPPFDSRGGPLLRDPDADRYWTWDGGTLRTLEWSVPAPYEPPPARALRERTATYVTWAFREGDNLTAQVERADAPGAPWKRIATVRTLPCGLAELADSTAPTASRVGYRLIFERAHVARAYGETWVSSTTPEKLSVLGVRPSPVIGPASVELALPIAGEVSLELFDLAGRRISRIERTYAAGVNVVTAPWPDHLDPGLYLLRVSDGQFRASRRVVVLR